MFWGVTLDGGKRYTQTVETSFHISMAALEPVSKDDVSIKANPIVSVMIQHDKAEFLLCTLQHGRLYQQPLDLNITEGEEVTFFLDGNGIIHLTGYLKEDDKMESTNLSDIEETEDDEEVSADDNSLEDVSVMQALNDAVAADDEDNDEDEWTPAKARSKKRKKSTPPTEEHVKKKKPNLYSKSKKNLDDTDAEVKKSEEEPEDDDDDKEEIDDEDDELEDDEEDDEEEDEEEEDEEEEDEEEYEEEEVEDSGELKLPDISVNYESDGPSIDSSGSYIIDNKTRANKSESSSKKDSSIKKKKTSDDKKKDAPNMNGIASESEETKKHTQQKPENSLQKKKTYSLEGGVKITDSKIGDGPFVKHGKMIHVYYSGRLSNNGKVFDSCLKGKPFKFRIGKGEVIKGWDIGLRGMRVGGKRTVVVPPALGYGHEKVPNIPPNSKLIFDIEVKAVS